MEKGFLKREIELSKKIIHDDDRLGYWIRKFIGFSLGIQWYEVIITELNQDEENPTIFHVEYCHTHKYNPKSFTLNGKIQPLKEIYSDSDNEGFICVRMDQHLAGIDRCHYTYTVFSEEIPIQPLKMDLYNRNNRL